MPLTVTWYSCIASSSAAWVLGGVRLISSARIRFAKTGPGMNRVVRRPVARSSSMTSVPMMSEGIRSGVNWMRLNLRWTACASVLISSVFARPGTPRSRQWPPATNTVRMSWTTACWPMMARPSSSRRRDARRCASSNESIGAIVSVEGRGAAPDGLRPGESSVRFEHFRAHVQFVAAKHVLGRTRFGLFQDLTVPTDELDPVFALEPLLDRDRDALRVRLVVGQLDAGGRVEVAALERLDDRPRRQALGPDEHPSAARAGDIRVARLFEHVRVIVCDAVQQLSTRKQAIPDLFHARDAAASKVVDRMMTVVDLEQLRSLHLPQFVGADRPAKVGVVDVRNAVGVADGVDVALDHVDHARSASGLDPPRHVEPVDVQRLLAEGIGDLFTLDDEEPIVGAVDGVETVDAREHIVIGQHQELIPVLPVPSHHVVRCAIAVAVERVGVRVSLVPTTAPRAPAGQRARTANRRDRDDCRGRRHDRRAARVEHQPAFWEILAQVSRSETVRLNTSASAVESGSTQK